MHTSIVLVTFTLVETVQSQSHVHVFTKQTSNFLGQIFCILCFHCSRSASSFGLNRTVHQESRKCKLGFNSIKGVEDVLAKM
jgi:hypothetical protein